MLYHSHIFSLLALNLFLPYHFILKRGFGRVGGTLFELSEIFLKEHCSTEAKNRHSRSSALVETVLKIYCGSNMSKLLYVALQII